MTGIFLLIVVGVWLAIAIALTRFIRARASLGKGWIRAVASFLIFVVLLVLPVADEIIGGFQFRALCEKESGIKIDADKARGRTVRLKEIPDPASPGYTDIPRKSISGSMVSIREDSWDWLDKNSREVIASYKTYSAKGGWLIRSLGISETNAPLTFEGSCGPNENGASLSKKFGLTVIN